MTTAGHRERALDAVTATKSNSGFTRQNSKNQLENDVGNDVGMTRIRSSKKRARTPVPKPCARVDATATRQRRGGRRIPRAPPERLRPDARMSATARQIVALVVEATPLRGKRSNGSNYRRQTRPQRSPPPLFPELDVILLSAANKPKTLLRLLDPFLERELPGDVRGRAKRDAQTLAEEGQKTKSLIATFEALAKKTALRRRVPARFGDCFPRKGQ